MSQSSDQTRSAAGTEAQFTSTHWTIVLAAADQQSSDAQEALEQLCRAYWYPLYGFLRRKRHSPQDAQDLVQGFFAHFLARESRLRSVHPAKGRFRDVLLAALKHYAANIRDKERAEKRGGGKVPIPIDVLIAEETYSHEPADLNDPAKLFERRWAFTVVEQTLARLKESSASNGKADHFNALSTHLTGDAERGDYAATAARLGLSEGAVRTAVSRLRDDYRKLLLQEIARTVDGPSEVDAEIRELFALFSR